MIGEGPGSVEDRVWANVPSFSPMDAVWGNAPAPNELHAALRQMSLGKAAGEDEVTAELLLGLASVTFAVLPLSFCVRSFFPWTLHLCDAFGPL